MTTFKIGAATVTRIEETYEPNFDAQIFFADWDPEIVAPHLSWMVPNHFDPQSGMLKLSVHSWLITIGGRTILIDTCVGNHKPRPTRPKWHMMETRYLERLAAAGVKPEQVDMVMCTHLHVDHVGWNTRLDNGRWVPTFPNGPCSARMCLAVASSKKSVRTRSPLALATAVTLADGSTPRCRMPACSMARSMMPSLQPTSTTNGSGPVSAVFLSVSAVRVKCSVITAEPEEWYG